MRNPLNTIAQPVNENDILSDDWFEKFAGDAPMTAPSQKLKMVNIDSPVNKVWTDADIQMAITWDIEVVKDASISQLHLFIRDCLELLVRKGENE